MSAIIYEFSSLSEAADYFAERAEWCRERSATPGLLQRRKFRWEGEAAAYETCADMLRASKIEEATP